MKKRATCLKCNWCDWTVELETNVLGAKQVSYGVLQKLTGHLLREHPEEYRGIGLGQSIGVTQ